MTTDAREDAHARSVRSPVMEIAVDLRAVLGERLTAVVADTSDAELVNEWARGRRSPDAAAERRLRAAYEVVVLVRQVDAPETIRAWFGGMNPHLDNQAPALAIGTQPEAVLQAALACIARG